MNREFLNLNNREIKPRTKGLTYVIDSGIPLVSLEGILQSADDYIDVVKFGWGSGLVTKDIHKKIDLLKKHNIDFYFGGTLFEIAYSQNKIHNLIEWISSFGTKFFEISDGSIFLEFDKKRSLIKDLSKDFQIIVEIGSKDADYVLPPSKWVLEINRLLEIGVHKIMAEGRESGTAGIYRNTGEVRMGLIEDILASGIPHNEIIFEAPNKEQQLWFIKNIDPNVNLGNINPYEVINLETLRLGLRSETLNI